MKVARGNNGFTLIELLVVTVIIAPGRALAAARAGQKQ